MFDCHYDLLTYIYINKKNIKPVIMKCNEIFQSNNITGGIFNFFYMSEKEMEDELGIAKKEINIIDNLKEVTYLIKEYNIIPNHVKYILGIEGLDYLNKIEDIDEIYNLGVRSVGIVWNNQNRFGGGVRAPQEYGLTEIGKQLVKKLVIKNIAIDLSHANKKTFYDIINQCNELKSSGLEPKVFASHSNCKNICNCERNLDNNQLIKIKELNGLIGVVSIKQFVSQNKKDNYEYMKEYMKHINYIRKIHKGSTHIALASDDMSYYNYQKDYYKDMNIFKQKSINSTIKSLLKEAGYIEEEIEGIINKNAEKFFAK